MRKVILALFVAVAIGYALPAYAADPAAGQTVSEKLGIETGYFSCLLPSDWNRTNDKGDDPLSYMLVFAGPRAEGAPTLIYIEYFADGNDYFTDYADFVQRNTFDPWEEKQIANAKETTVNGLKALWFEREEKSFLNPESKSDASVMIKEKFYVLLGKDRKGFFVLHYSAPISVFNDHVEKFEAIARSFQLL